MKAQRMKVLTFNKKKCEIRETKDDMGEITGVEVAIPCDHIDLSGLEEAVNTYGLPPAQHDLVVGTLYDVFDQIHLPALLRSVE